MPAFETDRNFTKSRFAEATGAAGQITAGQFRPRSHQRPPGRFAHDRTPTDLERDRAAKIVVASFPD
jgi:hypothetical protein